MDSDWESFSQRGRHLREGRNIRGFKGGQYTTQALAMFRFGSKWNLVNLLNTSDFSPFPLAFNIYLILSYSHPSDKQPLT